MKLLRKAIRIIALILLITLATIGIGISGAIPIFGSTKKDEFIETHTEQIDAKEESAEEGDLELK